MNPPIQRFGTGRALKSVPARRLLLAVLRARQIFCAALRALVVSLTISALVVMRALAVSLAICASAAALRAPRLQPRLVRKAQAACVGVALCSSAALASPTLATAATRAEELGYVQAQFEGTDPEAVIEVTAAAYPIIANLREKTFAPFVTKVAELVIKDRGAKYTADLAKSVDLGLDWFLSLSPEKVKDSTGAVRDAFKGLSPDTCALVPLPPAALFERVAASPAFAGADPAKLEAFEAEAKGVVDAFAAARSGDSVCLPTLNNVQIAALAQADAAESASPARSKAFVAQAKKTIGGISLGAAVRVANDAQFVTQGNSREDMRRFTDAGNIAETLVKRAVKKAEDRGCFAEGRRCDEPMYNSAAVEAKAAFGN